LLAFGRLLASSEVTLPGLSMICFTTALAAEVIVVTKKT